MRATAVIPVKRFGAAKQRLAAALDEPARGELAAAMLADVLIAARECASLERLLIVTGERRAVQLAARFGAEVIDDPRDGGQPAAAELGVAAALAAGAEAVALLPGDCPLLDPREVDAALGEHSPPFVGVVPDRHGTGTNALLLAPPDAIEPSFGEGSFARHVELAARSGSAWAELPLASFELDVDTPDDLARLRKELAADPGRATHTAQVLSSDRVAPGG